MSMFQIILLVVLGGLSVLVLVSGARKSIGRPVAAVILAVLTLGILAAVDPDRTTVIARGLGIDRGTDLILYLVTLVVLQGFFIFYLRLRKVRRELTILVRRLAILEAPASDAGLRDDPEEGRAPIPIPPKDP